MNSGFKVVQAGAQTLVQDGGRYGQHRLGLTTGGPMDARSFAQANTLCGNPAAAAALEITLGGLALQSQADTCIAVTGADTQLRINNEQQPLWQTLPISRGDLIELDYAARGCRNYLAVAGGFAITEYLGSCATVVREGIGGLHGQPLKQDDWLPCTDSKTYSLQQIPKSQRHPLEQHAQLRFVSGYQADTFSTQDTQRFCTSTYRLGQRLDRMGYCLEGEPLNNVPAGIRSEGICLGAVQITPEGQPIVLLRDRPTIGGYAKIGSVLPCDLDHLAQMTTGAAVQFVRITLQQAQSICSEARRAALNPQLQPL